MLKYTHQSWSAKTILICSVILHSNEYAIQCERQTEADDDGNRINHKLNDIINLPHIRSLIFLSLFLQYNSININECANESIDLDVVRFFDSIQRCFLNIYILMFFLLLLRLFLTSTYLLFWFYEIVQVSGACACGVESLYINKIKKKKKLWMTWYENNHNVNHMRQQPLNRHTHTHNMKMCQSWSFSLFANCRFACKSRKKSEFYTQKCAFFHGASLLWLLLPLTTRSISLTVSQSHENWLSTLPCYSFTFDQISQSKCK